MPVYVNILLSWIKVPYFVYTELHSQRPIEDRKCCSSMQMYWNVKVLEIWIPTRLAVTAASGNMSSQWNLWTQSSPVWFAQRSHSLLVLKLDITWYNHICFTPQHPVRCVTGAAAVAAWWGLNNTQHESNLSKLWSQVIMPGSKGQVTQIANSILVVFFFTFSQTFQLSSHRTLVTNLSIMSPVLSWPKIHIYIWVMEQSTLTAWEINFKRRKPALETSSTRFNMNIVETEHDFFLFLLCTETQGWFSDGLSEGWKQQSFALT